jgi:hypothetical protein
VPTYEQIRESERKVLEAAGWRYCEMILPKPEYVGLPLTWIVTQQGQPYVKFGVHKPPAGIEVKKLTYHTFRVVMEDLPPFLLGLIRAVEGKEEIDVPDPLAGTKFLGDDSRWN